MMKRAKLNVKTVQAEVYEDFEVRTLPTYSGMIKVIVDRTIVRVKMIRPDDGSQIQNRNFLYAQNRRYILNRDAVERLEPYKDISSKLQTA